MNKIHTIVKAATLFSAAGLVCTALFPRESEDINEQALMHLKGGGSCYIINVNTTKCANWNSMYPIISGQTPCAQVGAVVPHCLEQKTEYRCKIDKEGYHYCSTPLPQSSCPKTQQVRECKPSGNGGVWELRNLSSPMSCGSKKYNSQPATVSGPNCKNGE